VEFVLAPRLCQTPDVLLSMHGGSETFAAMLRSFSMPRSDTWYVSYGPDKDYKGPVRTSGPVRATRTFRSEADAKAFAREILSQGFLVSAGTLNPHQPKQIIAASQVEHWSEPDGV